MIINNYFKVRKLVLAGALITSLSLATHAAAESSYLIDLNTMTATPLGGLSGEGAYALGINDSGQVVGWSAWRAAGDRHAFITGPNGLGMRDLGTLGGYNSGASGINDSGQVVGWSDTAERASHAFITGSNGMGMRDLGPSSEAVAINNAGQAVIYSDSALITGPDGMGMRDLGLGPFVTGINNAGQVTGYFRTEHSIHAYITGPDGEGIRDIGTTPGGSMSHAWGINDSGQVVGHVTYELPADPFNEVVHAFITGPNGEGIRDLGTLAGHTLDDRHFSGAVDINDVGQVVGWSRTAEGPRHAFITGPDGEGMMDLNLLVDLPQAVILTDATGINNNGQVIAVGIVPEPETYALMFAGLGLIGFMTRRKKAVQNDECVNSV